MCRIVTDIDRDQSEIIGIAANSIIIARILSELMFKVCGHLPEQPATLPRATD